MLTPSHTRYAAPAAVRVAITSGERASTTATPAATTAVAARCPVSRPPTAGSTVLCRSPAAFQPIYDDRLAPLPGVQRLSSTLVMKTVVENRPLPL